MLRERVVEDGLVSPDRVLDPARATRDDLLRVHGADYVDRFATGGLDAAPLVDVSAGGVVPTGSGL